MSRRQLIKNQSQRKRSKQDGKFLTVNSKSREKSSSGDERKSENSLKKILYKHEIFDKQNPSNKFKTLHRIKEQQSEHAIKKYNSSEQFNWKDKVIGILEKEKAYKNQNSRQIFQREKPKSSSSRGFSEQFFKKKVQILEIENHEIIDEQNQISNQNPENNHKLQNLEIFAVQKVQQKKQAFKKSLKSTTQTQIQVIQVQKHSFDRDQQILSNKYLTNVKFLIAQTSQLFSYSKFMVLEEEIFQTKKKISELNIAIRKFRINMRNHEYTKEINFTFPLERHNDQILVKMPEGVEEKDMNKYWLMVEKIEVQKKIFSEHQEKIDNLEAYYETLSKKYEHVLQNNKVLDDDEVKKLTKSKSSESISNKSSKIQSSLASSNYKSPNKNIISSVRSTSPRKDNQKQQIETRYLTLLQKRQTLKQILQVAQAKIDIKTARLVEQIKLLKEQISLIDENIKTTEQSQQTLTQEIQNAKNRKYQKEENIEIQYQKLVKQRRTIYEKEKQTRSIETKGFTLFLRQNKSLSPLNYLSSPSNKIASNHSPRNPRNPELNKLQSAGLQTKLKNIGNAQFNKSQK